jgi:acyl carrier protein phosphodiesterase
VPLADFVNELYIHLIELSDILPPVARRISAFMIIRDWLGTYQNFDNLHQVFIGMHKRTNEKGRMDVAVEVLKNNYSDLEQYFSKFILDVQSFSEGVLHHIKA